MSQAFPAQARLKTADEFALVRARGFVQRASGFRVGFLPGQQRRLGLVVSAQVGGATARNRIKRSVREHFRRHAELWPRGDCVFIAQTKAAQFSAPDFFFALEKALAQLSTLPRPA